MPYRIGTYVKKDGKIYAYTPTDNADYNVHEFPNDFMEVDENFVKPPKAEEFKDIDIYDYNSNQQKFETGKYYSFNGNLYHCINGQYANSPGHTPKDPSAFYAWESVSDFYEPHEPYKTGDTVWYKGKNYKCVKPIGSNIDSASSRPGSNDYWEVVN